MKLYTLFSILTTTAAAGRAVDGTSANTPTAIPWCQISAMAGANYNGDGLAVMANPCGARLHCVFQRLDGDATRQGLQLISTVTDTVSDRFSVKAVAVMRKPALATTNSEDAQYNVRLAEAGDVTVDGRIVRFIRPGLTEEYSVSIDGVRQDFILQQPPPSREAGKVVVKLSVTGAQVQPTPKDAQLVLAKSGREIAYSHLRVTDAKGKELPAHLEVSISEEATVVTAPWSEGGSLFGDMDSFFTIDFNPLVESNDVRENGQEMSFISVILDDGDAVYPLRIDPTFSDANWISMGGIQGVNGTVYAQATDSSGNLYVGGTFTIAGAVFATNIAEWNGTSWSALDSGVNQSVNALAVSGTTLYAGGAFTSAGDNAANYIAQWNGTSWSPLGLGMSSNVNALAVSGGTLYAGGAFINAGGGAANYIAQWNGTSWSPLGLGVGSNVYALAVSGSTVYAGGAFTNAGSIAANYIAQWNGSGWAPVGAGMSSNVLALEMAGSILYAGGSFTNAGGNPANYIAQWNGSSWTSVGAGMNNYVDTVAVSGGTLYAGGNFTAAGGSAANGLAQWNGSSWASVGTPFPFPIRIYSLAVSGSILFVDGQLWNGTNFSLLGNGSQYGVKAMAVSGSTLYVGGEFSMIGGVAAYQIAQWNGMNWSQLGLGLGGAGTVSTLAVSGSTLYAGGYFTTAGGSNAIHIAQWNGTNWLPLGSGLGSGLDDGPVLALATSGAKLYAGGAFLSAGGNTVNFIAQWNGTNWSGLGSGMNAPVSALAASGNTLYAGGSFTNAGGTAANCVAQWNGSSWSPLGLGTGPSAGVLAASGNTLYVGGSFTNAGGSTANYIAQWNGTNWSPLGSGLNNQVSALGVSGNTLYVGGDFTTAGGVAANYIARWDGTNWSPLGSGLNNDVTALAVSSSSLYVSGSFLTAGTNVSAYLAEANLADVPASLFIITTNAAFGFTNGVFGFDVSGPPGSNAVVQATTDLTLLNWAPLQTNLLGSNGLLYFSDSQSPPNSKRFYRAVVP